jgi:hypothetical protein
VQQAPQRAARPAATAGSPGRHRRLASTTYAGISPHLRLSHRPSLPASSGSQPGPVGRALRGTVRIRAAVARHPKVAAGWSFAGRRSVTRRCYRAGLGGVRGSGAPGSGVAERAPAQQAAEPRIPRPATALAMRSPRWPTRRRTIATAPDKVANHANEPQPMAASSATGGGGVSDAGGGRGGEDGSPRHDGQRVGRGRDQRGSGKARPGSQSPHRFRRCGSAAPTPGCGPRSRAAGRLARYERPSGLASPDGRNAGGIFRRCTGRNGAAREPGLGTSNQRHERVALYG